jgi:uncharacterized membrane protein YukC
MNIFVIKLVTTIITYAAFIVFTYIDKSSYSNYLWIQSTMIQICFGAIVYFTFLYILKSDFQNSVINMVRKKLRLSIYNHL